MSKKWWIVTAVVVLLGVLGVAGCLGIGAKSAGAFWLGKKSRVLPRSGCALRAD